MLIVHNMKECIRLLKDTDLYFVNDANLARVLDLHFHLYEIQVHCYIVQSLQIRSLHRIYLSYLLVHFEILPDCLLYLLLLF
jgi:hypothetical protein